MLKLLLRNDKHYHVVVYFVLYYILPLAFVYVTGIFPVFIALRDIQLSLDRQLLLVDGSVKEISVYIFNDNILKRGVH